jgi:hypothetical protein
LQEEKKIPPLWYFEARSQTPVMRNVLHLNKLHHVISISILSNMRISKTNWITSILMIYKTSHGRQTWDNRIRKRFSINSWWEAGSHYILQRRSLN